MKKCDECGAEYEDFATFCNACDIALTNNDGQSLEEVEEEKEQDLEALLPSTRMSASRVHRIIGWLYFILSATYAFFMFVVGKTEIISYGGSVILLIPAVIHLKIAHGFLKGKKWARIASIVIGVLLLVGFPVGTIFGVIILYLMFKPEWKYA